LILRHIGEGRGGESEKERMREILKVGRIFIGEMQV